MDKPMPASYEVLELFLQLWERKKGEQALEPVHPSPTGSSGPSDLPITSDPLNSSGSPRIVPDQ